MTTNCHWCDEPILPGEPLSPMDSRNLAGEPLHYHWECGLRSVAGGLNHLNGLCSCCNPGSELGPDPEGVTRREAARMAAQAWLARNPPQQND